MKVLCAYGTRKSKPIVKSGLRKLQYTVTLFDCSHLTLAIVLWQMQKFMSLYKFLLCLIFNLRAISKYMPRGAYIREAINRRFFLRYEFRSLYLRGGAYFRNFTVFTTMSFSFILIIYMCVISCTYIFITMAKLMKNAIHSP